jgi:hypothetical protein
MLPSNLKEAKEGARTTTDGPAAESTGQSVQNIKMPRKSNGGPGRLANDASEMKGRRKKMLTQNSCVKKAALKL